MSITSFEPRTGRAGPTLPISTAGEVDECVASAERASSAVGATPPTMRAAWLRAVADALESDSPRLAELADRETGLGLPRLTGELAKAATALRFYADVAAEGSWLGATIDRPDAAGRPDLRRVNTPLGPVAVFGASNFPFGFGVLGHDTASALAAGCPVVVKAHPAHPLLSAALGELAVRTLAAAGAPAGTFGLVAGMEAGTRLVMHPSISAVAFTGSQAGGMALWQLAAARERVIPVFAEMGTVNTVVVTRSAAESRAEQIVDGFVQSFTLGTGQFCTKPGMLLVPSGHELPEAVGNALTAAAPRGWLLTEGIAATYRAGLERLAAAGATTLAQEAAGTDGWAVGAAALRADARAVTAGSPLLEECFGPVAIVVEYADDTELSTVLDALPGSLAAAVHGAGDADPQVAPLVARLAGRAGRVIVDGWPTGVAVTWAQQHGGPWPATTVPAASSVGAAALSRFVRPVAYQDVPDPALPPPLQDANPWELPRRAEGVCVSAP